MEGLEQRRLMAVGFSFSNGILKINGDGGENYARAYISGKNVVVKTQSTVTNGFSLVPFSKDYKKPASAVKEIRFYGRGGNDHFDNDTSITSRAYGGSGNDYLDGGSGRDYLYGESGNDTLKGRGGRDALRGGIGHDKIYGGSGNDYLYGDKGNDWLYGNSGNDHLKGAWGNDRLEGGTGNDRLVGGSNNDRYVFSGKKLGTDTVVGRNGYNTLDFRSFGGKVDVDLGKTSTQKVHSSHLRLKILDSAAIDRVYGSKYSDKIEGNRLANRLYGYGGSDTLEGAGGNDRLYGGSGNDTLRGDSGRDYLYGQAGSDILIGGSGNDVEFQDSKHVEIEVPNDQKQNDNWSCGPNSAYRILRHYGYDVTYSKMRNLAKRNSVLTYFGFGTTPKNLKEVMARYKSNTKIEREISLDRLIDVVSSGKPVAALFRVGKDSLGAKEVAAIGAAIGGGATPGGLVGGLLGGAVGAINEASNGPIAIPLMHWVTVTGVDKDAKTISYTDSDGKSKTLSYASFNKKWNWSAGGVPGKAFKWAGVTTRTIVY